MTNRLILNLSHTANAGEESDFRSGTGLDSPVFALNSVLGNIGGTMRTLPDDLFIDEPETNEEESSGMAANELMTRSDDSSLRKAQCIPSAIATNRAN